MYVWKNFFRLRSSGLLEDICWGHYSAGSRQLVKRMMSVLPAEQRRQWWFYDDEDVLFSGRIYIANRIMIIIESVTSAMIHLSSIIDDKRKPKWLILNCIGPIKHFLYFNNWMAMWRLDFTAGRCPDDS